MILSQPDVLGTRPHVDAVREKWVTFLTSNGKAHVKDPRKVRAYVNQNRWLADCPECNGGIACWDQNPEGCCLGCGHVYTVTWPKDLAAGVAALEQRPHSARNWMPGETVAQLKRENTEQFDN